MHACLIRSFGVPQISNLCPSLLILFNNDLKDIFECYTLLHVDDFNIFTKIFNFWIVIVYKEIIILYRLTENLTIVK